MEMEIVKPFTVDIKHIADDRGFLVPISQFLPTELQKEIKRTYVVGDYGKGVIRGLHGHRRETKIFYIIKGSAKFVAINMGDSTNKYEITLGERANRLFIVPPGYFNGWVSLEEGTLLVALSTSTFEESVKDDEREDPYRYGADIWGVKAR